MSVFTFDVDPPRVASPWLQPADSSKSGGPEQSASLADYGVTKLMAEPQEGPTEYKLHLLLRPRRRFEYMSTTTRVSGSMKCRPSLEPKTPKPMPVIIGSSGPSNQTRQDRLTHLTTQLLWRLQQSCPYNPGSASAELVIPQLPDEALTSNVSSAGGYAAEPPRLGKLPLGLGASRGALYEIGVADDGTLVGLTKDEMEESLRNLRIMASSLGCNMEVLRRVIVGDCVWMDWLEDGQDEKGEGDSLEKKSKRHQGNLWVAEALVTPELAPRESLQDWDSGAQTSPKPSEALPDPKQKPLTMNQLRVTLTGPTTCGKSTLLGTLTTGILDNGRGKSRQNLLKHRHELESGITSSVAQEIIGYHGSDIINYAHAGIESWIDVHDYTKDGRLVYLVDSAGHPRYRRTILRGVVGWAPHWTFVCMAADDEDMESVPGATASARDILGVAGAGVDLAGAHLDLCLQLETPVVIVVTKYDLASKTSTRRVFNKLLSSIKKAGRSHVFLRPDTSKSATEEVQRLVGSMNVDKLNSVVPIMLTSAVRGDGIDLVHALLQNLPLPRTPTSHDYIGEALNPEQPTCLFHIEDKFSLPASYSLATTRSSQPTHAGTVVAGYLRFGSLTVGDEVLIGPFPSEEDDGRILTPEDRPSPGGYGLSISHSSSAELSRIAQRNAISASAIKGEWHKAHIVSIRNIRLPVQTLGAGQVGSVGIVFFDVPMDKTSGSPVDDVPAIPPIRKGMVLAVPSQHMVDTGLSLQAASGLTACFKKAEAAGLTVGSLVNLYAASVRTAARIVQIARVSSPQNASRVATEDIDDVFSLNEDMERANGQRYSAVPDAVEVHLELLTNREWIELGSRVLLLEGGARDRSGLEGFVGKVVEIVD